MISHVTPIHISDLIQIGIRRFRVPQAFRTFNCMFVIHVLCNIALSYYTKRHNYAI